MRRYRAMALVALAATALLSGVPAKAIETDIRSYVCSKLDDFVATMKVVKADQRALNKIGKDFGMLYRFNDVQMRYKEPNMVRVEGTVEGTKGVYIVSGTVQLVSIPKIGMKTRRDFGNSPGKRKSLMDVGLVSEYYLTYATARFVREGTVEGTPVAVFDFTYKDRDEDTSHHMIYIDPKTKVVRRRDSYTQDGKLQAVYTFKNVTLVAPGIWFPTRVEVQTTDRVLAGVSEYTDIKVNTGMSDSIFR